jgi:hypothetical protein
MFEASWTYYAPIRTSVARIGAQSIYLSSENAAYTRYSSSSHQESSTTGAPVEGYRNSGVFISDGAVFLGCS